MTPPIVTLLGSVEADVECSHPPTQTMCRSAAAVPKEILEKVYDEASVSLGAALRVPPVSSVTGTAAADV